MSQPATSANNTTDCRRCHGTGQIRAGLTCPACNGTGHHAFRFPDDDD
ncbi:MAG TPA: hypothetical protein VFE45_18765 [Coriobacteriia bacterium]|nr:hypothetical protein [Coriobacteriia bacterium]